MTQVLKAASIAARTQVDAAVTERVAAIIANIRSRGDAAVREFLFSGLVHDAGQGLGGVAELEERQV